VIVRNGFRARNRTHLLEEKGVAIDLKLNDGDRTDGVVLAQRLSGMKPVRQLKVIQRSRTAVDQDVRTALRVGINAPQIQQADEAR